MPVKVLLVESLSLFRLISALVFACIAFQRLPRILVATLYIFAMGSDLVDGYLARRLKAETYFGTVVDLVSDKSMTIVSLLYAAARGISLAPLALIAVREVIMTGARIIVVGGTQLFPTSRTLGGVMAFLLWGNTLLLLLAGQKANLLRLVEATYWVCAVFYILNFVARVYASGHRIKISLGEDE